jgi:hypothetical protein
MTFENFLARAEAVFSQAIVNVFDDMVFVGCALNGHEISIAVWSTVECRMSNVDIMDG